MALLSVLAGAWLLTAGVAAAPASEATPEANLPEKTKVVKFSITGMT